MPYFFCLYLLLSRLQSYGLLFLSVNFILFQILSDMFHFVLSRGEWVIFKQ